MPPYGKSKAKKKPKMPMEDMMMPGGMPKHMKNKREMERAMGRKKKR